MPKYYIMLVNKGANQMNVPVKVLMNPYTHQPAYWAGMPQFFGGTDSDDQPPATVLEREITEESRRTLELTSGNPSHFFDAGSMFFYWAGEKQWSHTGAPWGDAQNSAEAEMERSIAIDLAQFHIGMTDEAIITELVNQTGSTVATRSKGKTILPHRPLAEHLLS
jgi:hypothetical protein